MQIPVRPVYPSISQYVATLNNILIVILGFLGVVEITKITFCGLFKKALKTLSLLFLFQIHRIKKLAIKQLIWTHMFQNALILIICKNRSVSEVAPEYHGSFAWAKYTFLGSPRTK